MRPRTHSSFTLSWALSLSLSRVGPSVFRSLADACIPGFVAFPRLSLSSSCAQVHSRELLRKGSEMAAKLVLLRKLTTAIRNFSVKVRLEGSLAEEEYMHQESGERRRYVSCAGVDGAGDRVSLAFFGPSVESLAGISVGDTVEMRGGQVRIRDGVFRQHCAGGLGFRQVREVFESRGRRRQGDRPV